eukprot:CAMPEP_0115750342 /NCGR_PEP_ID=MMETSP0272-20121206/94675_1 /TAXON_ID=71861 /ORGANISM="Scrippsiella trochoidea, Strain CCMP3099" /LENGTH=90 /DNA_ID=CAMNT_0003195455 /DNA_START=24 /DNA_END=293 /DNA_ORIENTATION=-
MTPRPAALALTAPRCAAPRSERGFAPSGRAARLSRRRRRLPGGRKSHALDLAAGPEVDDACEVQQVGKERDSDVQVQNAQKDADRNDRTV